MKKHITRRPLAIFLSLAMVIGLLPTMIFKVNAAYPDPYQATVNSQLTMSVSELTGINNFDNGDLYVYGFSKPSNGSHSVQIYLANPGDCENPDYQNDGYMNDKDDDVSNTIDQNSEVIHFIADQTGIYKFWIKVHGGKWSTPSSERQFGISNAPGDLSGSGSSRWKQRAFNDYRKDVLSLVINRPLVRISVYDKIGDYTVEQILDSSNYIDFAPQVIAFVESRLPSV